MYNCMFLFCFHVSLFMCFLHVKLAWWCPFFVKTRDFDVIIYEIFNKNGLVLSNGVMVSKLFKLCHFLCHFIRTIIWRSASQTYHPLCFRFHFSAYRPNQECFCRKLTRRGLRCPITHYRDSVCMDGVWCCKR